MKKYFLLLIVVILSVTSCKTHKFVVKEEAVTVVNASPNDISYKYYVILGSFEDLQNAKNYESQIKSKGFTSPVILKSELGYYRVAVYSSDFEKDARNRIASILEMYPEHKDVWLLIKK
jgi:cell division protein FtsN